MPDLTITITLPPADAARLLRHTARMNANQEPGEPPLSPAEAAAALLAVALRQLAELAGDTIEQRPPSA